MMIWFSSASVWDVVSDFSDWMTNTNNCISMSSNCTSVTEFFMIVARFFATPIYVRLSMEFASIEPFLITFSVFMISLL